MHPNPTPFYLTTHAPSLLLKHCFKNVSLNWIVLSMLQERGIINVIYAIMAIYRSFLTISIITNGYLNPYRSTFVLIKSSFNDYWNILYIRGGYLACCAEALPFVYVNIEL